MNYLFWFIIWLLAVLLTLSFFGGAAKCNRRYDESFNHYTDDLEDFDD